MSKRLFIVTEPLGNAATASGDQGCCVDGGDCKSADRRRGPRCGARSSQTVGGTPIRAAAFEGIVRLFGLRRIGPRKAVAKLPGATDARKAARPELLSIVSFCVVLSAQPTGHLNRLFQAHQWFELRSTVTRHSVVTSEARRLTPRPEETPTIRRRPTVSPSSSSRWRC